MGLGCGRDLGTTGLGLGCVFGGLGLGFGRDWGATGLGLDAGCRGCDIG